jgi:hypothetical protein
MDPVISRMKVGVEIFYIAIAHFDIQVQLIFSFLVRLWCKPVRRMLYNREGVWSRLASIWYSVELANVSIGQGFCYLFIFVLMFILHVAVIHYIIFLSCQYITCLAFFKQFFLAGQ